MSNTVPEFDAFSFNFSPQNSRAIQWGPGDNVAISDEHLVSIYNIKGFNLIRTISRHKSTITSLRWSSPTVEPMKSDSFSSFLAIGDNEGNCIIYDALTGARHAGISPLPDVDVSIIDIQWSIQRSSIIFILTTAHDNTSSLLCFQVGSTAHRHSSSVESCADHGMPFQTFNMSPIWAQSIPYHVDFISIDPINPTHVLLASSSGQYCGIQLNENSTISSPSHTGSFKTQNKILSIGYYPYARDRLLILTQHSITIFDLKTSSHSLILSSNTGSMFIPISSYATHSDPEHFWLASEDGTLTRFFLYPRNTTENPSNDEKWGVLAQQTGISSKLIGGCSDPLNPSRIIITATGGRIFLFEEKRKKLFLTTIKPGLSDSSINWDANQQPGENQPIQVGIIASNQLIGLMYNGSKYRFKLDPIDKTINTIKFIKNDLYISGQKALYKLNWTKRFFEKTNSYHSNCSKIRIYDDCIVSLPFPHVLEITFPDSPKRQIFFKDPITCFARHCTDPSNWAIITSSFQLFIVHISEIENGRKVELIKKLPFERVAGEIINVLYIGENAFIATTSGLLARISIGTGMVRNLTISSTAIQRLYYFGNYIFTVDAAQLCCLVNPEIFQRTAVSKIKLMDCRYLGDFCIAQISRTMFRLIQFPSLAPYTLPYPISDNYKTVFFNSERSIEMEEIASSVGDLDFVQFMRIVRGCPNLPLSATFTLPRSVFVADARCTHVCDFGNKFLKEQFMDHFILTGERERAADYVLKDLAVENYGKTEDKFQNERNLLLAAICLSPSKEAIEKVSHKIDVTGLELTIARLYALAGDIRVASILLTEAGEFNEALKYLKFGFDDRDDIGKELLCNWVRKRGALELQYTVQVLIGDFHAALGILERSNEFSKAVAFGRWIKENEIKVQPSTLQKELELDDYDIIWDRVQQKWLQISKLFIK